MNVFDTHRRIVEDYAQYIRSFINISDPEIARTVRRFALRRAPLASATTAVQSCLRTSRYRGRRLSPKDCCMTIPGTSSTGTPCIAINAKRLSWAWRGTDFVVTSGTGSGKSLTYIGTIFNHLLANRGADGVAAVIVYPMNALVNSQTNEFNTYTGTTTRGIQAALFPLPSASIPARKRRSGVKRCARSSPASPPYQLHDARTPAYSRAGTANSRRHL